MFGVINHGVSVSLKILRPPSDNSLNETETWKTAQRLFQTMMRIFLFGDVLI
jgi:hypothetical protein